MPMDKYAWIHEELAQIHTNKFFVFDKDVDESAIRKLEEQFGILPDDYKSFLLSFGGSRFFRKYDSSNGSYVVDVLAKPCWYRGRNSPSIIFGGYGEMVSLFPKKEGSPKFENEVLEGHVLGGRFIASSFDEWLKKRFESARKSYSKKRWELVLKGPAPFTEQEQQIVDAIPLFTFQIVGIARNKDLKIKVHNGSKIRLPYLSVGVHVPGCMYGGIYLKVGDIAPGETRIVQQDAYKDLYPPKKVELFREPLPDPSERPFYGELLGPEWLNKIEAKISAPIK